MAVMFLACARAVGAVGSFGGFDRSLVFLGIGSTGGKGLARLFPVAKKTCVASASVFSTFVIVALGVGVAAMVAIRTLINVTACDNVSGGGFVAVMFCACAPAVGAFGRRVFGGWGCGLDFLGIVSAGGMGLARFSVAKETIFARATMEQRGREWRK